MSYIAGNHTQGDLKPEIDIKVKESNFTALHFAVQNENEKLVELLL
jgi:hypothetical protein